MSTENKPRTFWILWKSGYKNQATVTEQKPKEYNDTLTQVIEMAAVEQLKAELKKRLSGYQHNHITRDIKEKGKCPACDLHHDKGEIEQLKSKLEKAKKGLEFYANGKNWQNFDLEHEADPDCEADYEHLNPERPRLITGGKKARQALKEINEG